MQACGGDDLFSGDVTVAGFAFEAAVLFDLGFFELDEARIEGVAQDVADGLTMPDFAARGRDVLFVEVVDKLARGLPAQEAVFDLDQDGGEGGDGFGDGFAVVLFMLGAAISERDLDGQMIDEDAVAHARAIFAPHAGDLGFGADGGDADQQLIRVVFVRVILVGRDGGVLRADGE